jgi:hypothetical protein
MTKRNRSPQDAAADWMDAKNAETAANKKRIEAEIELASFFGNKPEGAESYQEGPYKITLTGRLNRKIDYELLAKLDIPADLSPVKQKPELDLKGLRYIEANEPEIYKLFTKAMTVEPAKTSVTVIRTEK